MEALIEPRGLASELQELDQSSSIQGSVNHGELETQNFGMRMELAEPQQQTAEQAAAAKRRRAGRCPQA